MKNYKYITIPFSICPLTALIYIATPLVNAFLPAALVLATADFIDKAVLFAKNKEAASEIGTCIITLLLCIALSHISKIAGEYAKSTLKLKIPREMRLRIVEKKLLLPITVLENEEQCNFIERVSSGCEKRFYSGFVNCLQLIEYIIRAGCFVVIVASALPVVAIILTVVAVVLFKVALKCGKEDYKAFEETAGARRYARALRNILSSRENVEERNLFQYSKYVQKKWQEKSKCADDAEINAIRKNAVHTKTANIITVVITLIIALVLIFPIKTGDITLGLYLALIKQIMNLVETLTWQLNPLIEEFETNRQYLLDYERFLQLKSDVEKNQVDTENAPEKVEITFSHVSFRYPGTEKYILKDFSFTFQNKKSYALVGVNGAGKTTIVKILLGFYEDYEGTILLNGIDIRQIGKSNLKEYFSVVYQDFARFPVTVKEFLEMGQDNTLEMRELSQVLEELGMSEFMKKLSLGFDTPLGKLHEEGTELSGGEWQKLAIARCMLRTAPIRILDEPTAAVDPVSEAQLYETFEKMSRNFLAIIITHRLALAKKADEIVVLDGGNVKEHGNHAELMKMQGIYGNMFKMQRRWYQNETGVVVETDFDN